MTLPLTDHPVVRAEAERMAREHAERMQRHGLGSITPHAGLTAWAIELLCDLSLDASRDWWVRWGCQRDRQRVADTALDTGDAAADAQHQDRRLAARERLWHALRDNPEALAASILSALEQA